MVSESRDQQTDQQDSKDGERDRPHPLLVREELFRRQTMAAMQHLSDYRLGTKITSKNRRSSRRVSDFL